MNFQIQHSTTNIKYVYLSLSENSQKYKLFSQRFFSLLSVPNVVYQIASFHRNCYCLPEITASAIQSVRNFCFSPPETATVILRSARNCCFSPPEDFQISFFCQKLLLLSARKLLLLLYYHITSFSRNY